MTHDAPTQTTIPASDYRPIMRACDARAFLKMLRNPKLATRMDRVVAGRRSQLRDVVRAGAARLERATKDSDFDTVYGEAHEIRGIAETGGLAASGRIADRLCLYLDAVTRAGLAVDGGIVGLHVGAITRASCAEDEATRLGSEVAEQLGALVARKLGPAAPEVFR